MDEELNSFAAEVNLTSDDITPPIMNNLRRSSLTSSSPVSNTTPTTNLTSPPTLSVPSLNSSGPTLSVSGQQQQQVLSVPSLSSSGHHSFLRYFQFDIQIFIKIN